MNFYLCEVIFFFLLLKNSRKQSQDLFLSFDAVNSAFHLKQTCLLTWKRVRAHDVSTAQPPSAWRSIQHSIQLSQSGTASKLWPTKLQTSSRHSLSYWSQAFFHSRPFDDLLWLIQGRKFKDARFAATTSKTKTSVVSPALPLDSKCKTVNVKF